MMQGPSRKRDHSSQISCPVANILVYGRQLLMRNRWERVSDRWEEDWGTRRRRDTWDVVAAQQNSSQWGQAASALLIASPCQTIFKRNLLMQCGPAYFCFYPFSFESSFFHFLSLFISSSFHVLAPFRDPPTRVSSPGSVGGRYPVLPYVGSFSSSIHA